VNQEELKEYFGHMHREDCKIDLNNIAGFLQDFHKNFYMSKFIENTIKHSEKPYYDASSILFFKSFVKLCFCRQPSTREISMGEFRLRAVVLEYYFPDFMNTFFVPHMEKNKNSDINALRRKVDSTKMLYSDTTNPHHIKQVNDAIHRYEFVKERYDMDIDYEIKCIQSITETIRANEAQSQLPLSR